MSLNKPKKEITYSKPMVDYHTVLPSEGRMNGSPSVVEVYFSTSWLLTGLSYERAKKQSTEETALLLEVGDPELRSL